MWRPPASLQFRVHNARARRLYQTTCHRTTAVEDTPVGAVEIYPSLGAVTFGGGGEDESGEVGKGRG